MSCSQSKPKAVPCYGKCRGIKCQDYSCEYRESCKIYADICNGTDDLSLENCDKKIQQADDETVYAAMTRLFMWLLSVDCYTLHLMQQILVNKKESITEISSDLDISRQAVHQKMLDAIIKHPELALLFQTVITKITKTETYFVKKSKERKKEK